MINSEIKNGIAGDVDTSEEYVRDGIYEKLASEGYESLIDYIERLGMKEDQSYMILSPNNHLYYDAYEFENVDVVMNLRHLNHIKQVKDYLASLCHLLPMKSYLVGSFIDRKSLFNFGTSQSEDQNRSEEKFDLVENGIESRIPLVNLLYNIMDARTNKVISKRMVRFLLEKEGMKVVDISEHNDITYFCAQSSDPVSESKRVD